MIGLGFFVQITGINAVVYFGPQIFESMGVVSSDLAKLGLSALVQLFALLAVFGSMLSGRPRSDAVPLLLIRYRRSWSPSNLLLIATFRSGTEDGATITLGGTLTFDRVSSASLFFVVGFTMGFGALMRVFAGESFPFWNCAPLAPARC